MNEDYIKMVVKEELARRRQKRMDQAVRMVSIILDKIRRRKYHVLHDGRLRVDIAWWSFMRGFDAWEETRDMMLEEGFKSCESGSWADEGLGIRWYLELNDGA